MRLLMIMVFFLLPGLSPAWAQTGPVVPPKGYFNEYFTQETWGKLTPGAKRDLLEHPEKKRLMEEKAWQRKYDKASPAVKKQMDNKREAEKKALREKWEARYEKAKREKQEREKRQRDETR